MYPDRRRQKSKCPSQKSTGSWLDLSLRSHPCRTETLAAFCVIPLSQQLDSPKALPPVGMAWALFLSSSLYCQWLFPHPLPQICRHLHSWFLPSSYRPPYLPALFKHTLRKLLAFVTSFTCAKSPKSCRAEHGGGGRETDHF